MDPFSPVLLGSKRGKGPQWCGPLIKGYWHNGVKRDFVSSHVQSSHTEVGLARVIGLNGGLFSTQLLEGIFMKPFSTRYSCHLLARAGMIWALQISPS